MNKDIDAAEPRDLETVSDDAGGVVETFIQERPLVAVAMALAVGVFLARRLFHARPKGTA